MNDIDQNPERPLPPDTEAVVGPLFEEDENLVQKGDYYDLLKAVPTLKELMVSAGWDQKMFEENALDIDLSCFLLNKADQTREDQDFVFYNNEKACDGAVRYTGDSRTGAGDGDDESITITLSDLPFDILKIVFTLSIYNAPERDQHFGQTRSMYLRISNMDNKNQILRYKMGDEEFTGQICIKVGELVREGPKWYFNVLGEPVPGGLAGIATKYGLIIQM